MRLGIENLAWLRVLLFLWKQAKPEQLVKIKYIFRKEKEVSMTSLQHYYLNGTNPTKLENILDVLIDEQFADGEDHATDPLTGITWPIPA